MMPTTEGKFYYEVEFDPVHDPLPVAGYTPQSGERIVTVNEHKVMEERILRRINALQRAANSEAELRWLSIAKTHFEQAFMALNRSVFMPERIALPEDALNNAE
jgi:hypothetical protein